MHVSQAIAAFNIHQTTKNKNRVAKNVNSVSFVDQKFKKKAEEAEKHNNLN